MFEILITKSDELEITVKKDCDIFLRCEINIRPDSYSAYLDSNPKSLKLEKMFLVYFKQISTRVKFFKYCGFRL